MKNTDKLRKMFNEALSVLGQMEDFKSNMDMTNDDDIKYAYHLLFKKFNEKLQKKINEIADAMNCNNAPA